MDPFAQTIITGLKGAYSLHQFMTGDMASVISKVHTKAAKYFMDSGEYESAKTLLVDAYFAEKGRRGQNALSYPDEKLYQLSLSIAICYQAIGKPSKATEWQQKASAYLKNIEDRAKETLRLHHSVPWWLQTGPKSRMQSNALIHNARSTIAWVEREKQSMSETLRGVAKLR